MKQPLGLRLLPLLMLPLASCTGMTSGAPSKAIPIAATSVARNPICSKLPNGVSYSRLHDTEETVKEIVDLNGWLKGVCGQ